MSNIQATWCSLEVCGSVTPQAFQNRSEMSLPNPFEETEVGILCLQMCLTATFRNDSEKFGGVELRVF